jgi:hypothetical protein
MIWADFTEGLCGVQVGFGQGLRSGGWGSGFRVWGFEFGGIAREPRDWLWAARGRCQIAAL